MNVIYVLLKASKQMFSSFQSFVVWSSVIYRHFILSVNNICCIHATIVYKKIVVVENFGKVSRIKKISGIHYAVKK